MFRHIASTTVFVRDQDAAKDFYVNTLGFVLRTDVPMYPGAPNRWLAVAPTADAVTELVLDIVVEESEHYRAVVGKSQAITIRVEGIHALVASLREKGVRFNGDVAEAPWGTHVFMCDQDDNVLLLIEPPAAS
jgi:catechol 2,3-dioxygenase-like lactoylglutathione lyase family enzyme